MDNLEIATALEILFMVIGTLIIILGIILTIKNSGGRERGCSTISICISMMIGAFAIIASQIIPFDNIVSEFKTTSEEMSEVRSTDEIYTEAVNNGYTVYVDGTEVKPDTINASDYKMTVNDDNHSILLSTSDGDSRTRLTSLLIILIPIMLSLSLFKK